ncbi:MAG: hypothetical protein Q8P72_06240, partial [Candidatus Roizmanbacteria bacterium]|nr:hypothetical protein [Candidatus Roizmanbacteria bacterium]
MHSLLRFGILLLIFFLPTQLGMFFFIPESYISGIRIDYLAPTVYFTDLIIVSAIIIFLISIIRSNKHIVLTKKCVELFKNKVTIFIFILIVLNIFFSLELVISLYRYSKLLEIVFVYFVVRHTKILSKHILWTLVLSTFLQLLLVALQIVSRGSIQGIWYLLGERSFHLGTPGIAKISLRGVEMIRGYGTFSHPNSLAGFYLLLYSFVLFLPPSSQTRFGIHAKKLSGFQLGGWNDNIIQSIILAASTLLILFSFSKIAIV